MENKQLLLIRYGELTLKGKNRGEFKRCLFRNIKQALTEFKRIKINFGYDATTIESYSKLQESKIINILKFVPGISLIIPVIKTKHQ
jgi:thiamine biosynthesis protein ThiI